MAIITRPVPSILDEEKVKQFMVEIEVRPLSTPLCSLAAPVNPDPIPMFAVFFVHSGATPSRPLKSFESVLPRIQRRVTTSP